MPCQRRLSRVLMPWDASPEFTASNLRLPQPGGSASCIYFPQEQGSPVTLQAFIALCLKFEVTLRLTVSQSLCLGIEQPSETCDLILLPTGMLLSEICGLVSVGRPLWQEHGSAICSVITQWSESCRTHNHTLLSHLRLLQPGEPGSHIYIPKEHGGPVRPPGIGLPSVQQTFPLVALGTYRTESRVVVKAICYKPESSEFETPWGE
jgi:hypothetical protein